MEPPREIVMSRWRLAFNFNTAWLIRYSNFTWPRLNIEDKHMKIPQTKHKLLEVLPFTLFIGQWKPCHKLTPASLLIHHCKRKCVVMNWGRFLCKLPCLFGTWGGRHTQPCCLLELVFLSEFYKYLCRIRNIYFSTESRIMCTDGFWNHIISVFIMPCLGCTCCFKKPRTQCR